MKAAESLSFRLLVSTGNKKVGWYSYVQSVLLDSFTSTSKTSTLLPLNQFPANFHGNNNVDRHILASRCRCSPSLVSASYPFWNVAVIEDSNLLVGLGTSTPLARRTSDRARSETRVLDPPEKGKELRVIISRGMGLSLLRRGYPPQIDMGFRYRTNCNVG
jgi:hypothetical protein